jgi:ABC-type branched-subunit amino acid transport system substrate-binding protein
MEAQMPKDASHDLNSGISRRTLVRAGLGAIAAPAVLRVIPANAQSRVIKIGHVSPKTGPLAGFGEADGFILEQVRGILSKGLQSGGRTYQVQIISKDSQSSGSRAAEVASELILGDKVDLILASARHHQSGRRPGRGQRGALHHHQLSVAALFLRAQGRSGQGLHLDLPLLLGA